MLFVNLRLIASAFCSQRCWLLLSAPLSFICGNGLDENLCQPTDNHKLQTFSSNFECIGSVDEGKGFEVFPPPGVNLLPLLAPFVVLPHAPPDCGKTLIAPADGSWFPINVDVKMSISLDFHWATAFPNPYCKNITKWSGKSERERQGGSKAIILNAFSQCQRLPCIIQSLFTVW